MRNDESQRTRSLSAGVTLLTEAGSGPGGVVYRGVRDGAPCFIKLPPSDQPGAVGRSTFEREVLELARLHLYGLPQVVHLAARDEPPFAILAAVSGRSFDSWCMSRPTKSSALDVAIALIQAVVQLHARGFLHDALTSEQVQVTHSQGLQLLDLGAIHRPARFEPRPNLRALGELLAALAGVVRNLWGAERMLAIVERWRRNGGTARELLRNLEVLRNERRGQPRSLGATLPCPSPVTMPHASTTPLRDELAHLQQRLDNRTLGPVIVVEGPEGSGKTRLLSDFGTLILAQGVNVLFASCTSVECGPFSTIQTLLDNHLDDLEPYPDPVRSAYVTRLRETAGAFGSRLRTLSERLDRALSPAPETRVNGDLRESFMDGLAQFLARYLDALGRSVVILDNLQHLDASSRIVLARLANQLRNKPHALVGAFTVTDAQRSESLDRLDAMLTAGQLQRMMLTKLSRSDALATAAEQLGTRTLNDDEVVTPLCNLSDGTPRSLIELIELALSSGLLRPHHGEWQLHREGLSQLSLPGSARSLLQRRLALHDGLTLQTLQAAATVGMHFDATLLAAVTGISPATTAAALDRATADGLLIKDAHDRYVFIHEAACDALLHGLSEADKRNLHQAVADALRQTEAADRRHEYALARHIALGCLDRQPAGALAILQRAGMQAAAAHDDALTMLFLRAAERAAELARLRLERADYLRLAEACQHTGASEDSLRYFELALTRSRPGLEAAHVLGRIAWTLNTDGRADAAWEKLKAALHELEEAPIPTASKGWLRTGVQALRTARGGGLPKRTPAELETLCELYVSAIRFAAETGNPLAGLRAYGRMLYFSRDLHPCRAKVDVELYKAFGLSVLSKGTQHQPLLDRAHRLAEQLGDRVAIAKCHHMEHAIAGWRGDIATWIAHGRVCAEEYANDVELGETCLVAYSVFLGLAMLGKAPEGFTWIERAYTRAQQLGVAPATFSLIEDAACSHLRSIGRATEAEDLKRRLSHVRRAPLQPNGVVHLLTLVHRAQRWVDNGARSDELAALASDWKACGQQPTAVHRAAALFYVHMAHARLHECLHAQPHERAARIRLLRAAVKDLQPIRFIAAIRAHSSVVQAGLAFMLDERVVAERHLARGEQLAREEHCVWATWAAARLRAHMLRASGRLASAREHAAFAVKLARDYSAFSQAQLISAEFLLEEEARGESPRARRHLEALLHIAHKSGAELSPQLQARFVLNELLQSLAAERGFLFMSAPNRDAPECLVALRHDGVALSDALCPAELALVEQVYESGRTARCAPAADRDRVGVAVALVLREIVVGVIYLDRHSSSGAFTPDDVGLIEALANQVPVVLELAHALRERTRLERNLREAQKMEALGRLAAGIAHDFNNILGTIEFSASCLTQLVPEEAAEELADISDAASRGATLTKHLMLFARGNTVPTEPVDLAETLQAVEPLLVRMARSVSVQLLVSEAPLYALAEPSQVERIVMNLCRNASDAMPDGGTVTIRLTHVQTLPAKLAATTDNTRNPLGYAVLSVRDTGHGMNEDTRARLFEPFFTTKAETGTGLGLAIVYTIVQQCQGHIGVASTPQGGTTFTVYLPLCAPLRRSPEKTELGSVVCLVDDDDTFRPVLARAVRRAGYDVLTACSGKDALRVIADAPKIPELLVTDVHMPGLDGVELARRLRASHPRLKILFISGHEASVCDPAVSSPDAAFLRKPFTGAALVQEIERLLDAPVVTPAIATSRATL